MAETGTNLTFSENLTNKLNDVSDALPADFNKARFVQNSLALMLDNVDTFKNIPPAEITGGLLKGAFLGLDFFNKECYLIPYGKQLNFQVDYKGAKKLCKKYAIRPVLDIDAKLIREGDEFTEIIEGGVPSFSFKPKPLNDGRILGAFAWVRYEDGGMAYDVMTLKELENTRNHSKAKNSPAWRDYTGQMYLKTVIHRLCKHIELDFENVEQQKLYRQDLEGNVVLEPTEVENPFGGDEYNDIIDSDIINEEIIEEEING